MLKHLSCSGMNFFLHIFNLPWSLHSISSIWKTSSIIPIHKMEKPLNSPASFRPVSFTSCDSKLFQRIILSCLLFFLESNSILSFRQADFRAGRSTLDQILYFSQSISNEFNKPRPGSLTILTKFEFFKAFAFVWHPALFHKLISAGLPSCFACWTQSFFSDRRTCVVFKITKVVPFESVEVFCKDPFLVLYFSLFSSVMSLNLCLLPSAALFILTTLSFGPPPAQSLLLWRPHKDLWFDWIAVLNTDAFLSIRGNMRRLSSQWIPTKLTSSPISPYSIPLRFNPTPTFLGVTFDRTLSFSKHVFCQRPSFFLVSRPYLCISASSWSHYKESLSHL